MGYRHLAIAGLTFLAASAGAATFTPLGPIYPSAVTDDGSVIYTSNGEAFRRTSSGELINLGSAPGDISAVSADGSIVVGSRFSPAGREAYRWVVGDAVVGLGGLPGGSIQSEAYGLSGDGNVVVGVSINTFSPFVQLQQAFRWTATGGMVGLGGLPGGGDYSFATGVSADGEVVVGIGLSASGQEAFRWTSDGGMGGLGDLPGSAFQSGAIAVSADGRFVVGQSASEPDVAPPLGGSTQAFLWSSDAGMTGLGDLPGGLFDSFANGVSDNGVVVGRSESGGPNPAVLTSVTEAFVWTSEGGMQRLLDVLVANGATDVAGWVLAEAKAISSDGQWVIGYGNDPLGNSQGFLANITPVPIPAAAWLFASALAGLAWLRRMAGQ